MPYSHLVQGVAHCLVDGFVNGLAQGSTKGDAQ